MNKDKINILDELKADYDRRQAAMRERERKINSIEGLQEIRDAYHAEDRYRAAFERMMDDESNDGACPPTRPTADIPALLEKYPRAAAYLEAERYSMAAHYVKAAAGRKAIDAIIDGEDYQAAIAAMEKKWADHVAASIWD